MDEHIVVDGKIVHENIMIVDDNKMGFEFWLKKHIGYAKEAVDMLFIKYDITCKNKTLKNASEASKKRVIKKKSTVNYQYFFVRIIFIYRYFIRFGF